MAGETVIFGKGDWGGVVRAGCGEVVRAGYGEVVRAG